MRVSPGVSFCSVPPTVTLSSGLTVAVVRTGAATPGLAPLSTRIPPSALPKIAFLLIRLPDPWATSIAR